MVFSRAKTKSADNFKFLRRFRLLGGRYFNIDFPPYEDDFPNFMDEFRFLTVISEDKMNVVPYKTTRNLPMVIVKFATIMELL